MRNKDKLSAWTRARLCWAVLTRGRYDPRDYKTIREEEQWEICEERRKEMAACVRPREDFLYEHKEDEQ